MLLVVIFGLVALFALWGVLRSVRNKNILGFLLVGCHLICLWMVYRDDRNKQRVSNRTLKPVSDRIQVYFYGCKCLLTLSILLSSVVFLSRLSSMRIFVATLCNPF